MRLSRLGGWLIAASLPLAALPAVAQTAFTAGNLVVYRVGDGSGSLSGNGNPVFIEEFAPTGGAPVQTIALPSTEPTAPQRPCIGAGNATSEGYISLSNDGQFVVGGCYAQALPNATALGGSPPATINRVIFRISAAGVVDTSTSLNDATGNARGAGAGNGGNDLWLASSSASVRHTTFGTAGASTQLMTSPTNTRSVQAIGGQLYLSLATSGTPAPRLGTIGTGLPTTSGQSFTNLPGAAIPGLVSPYGFALLDRSAAIAGPDTLYVADDAAVASGGGIRKFTFDGTEWTARGTLATQTRGITARIVGSTVEIFATTIASPTTLVRVVDTAAFDEAITGTPEVIATAATNTAFRGVALAPVSAAPTPPSGVGSATPATIPNDGSTTSALRVVVTPGTNPVSTGIAVTANLTALGGSATQALVDDGTGCDATAGDLNFCANTTAPPATPPGPYSITFAITDAQARNGGGSIALTVVDATPADSTLSIGPATVTTGLLGTQTVNVPVTINPPRPVDVAFTATTGGGTATPGPTPPADYIALAAQSVTIPANTGSFNVPVTIHPNLRPTSSKTFTVTIASSAPNVVLGTAVATVTIDNNAAASTPIPAIQGSGDVSPLAGQTLTSVDNIVTATVANGFVMQARAPGDGNPATSDAMFVFTGSAPTVAVGDVVDVRGRAGDFTSASGGRSLNATQFFNTNPTLVVVRLGSANVAATTQAITLDDVIPSPNPSVPACVVLGGVFAPTADPRARNFACLEYMRVGTTSGVITSPNQRFGTGDPLAEMGFATSGRRAFREPGVSFNVSTEDPVLANLVPAAPLLPAGFVFDGNPEVFEFDPDRLGLPNAVIVPGSALSAQGVIGIDFADYEFWPNQFQVTQAAAALPRPVPTPAADQFKVASYNLLNLFDRCDDPARPNSNETFNVADTNRKLEKHSRYIREVLAEPGIIAVQEVELPSPQATVCANAGGTTTSALQLLADRIAADGGQTYLVANSPSTNDPRFISVGFLYRQDLFLANIALTQVAPAETWTFRYVDGNAATQERSGTVHDRPPLRMEATAPLAGGGEQRFALVVNHFRSLSGIDDLRDTRETGATLADPTFRQDAHRVRQKRLRQAISMACSVQAWQSSPANAGVPLILLGDHNAFEFSDGYADLNALLIGNASPATAQYVGSYWPPAELPCTTQSGGQFVAPGLENAVIGLPAVERYSFNFQFNAQALDHALLNGPAQARFEGVVYGRGNSDAPVNDEFDAATARRASDHDALVLYFNLSSTRPSTSGFGIFKDGLEAP